MGCGSSGQIDENSQNDNQKRETDEMQSKLNEIKKRKMNQDSKKSQENVEKQLINNLKQRKNNNNNRMLKETNENEKAPYNPYNNERSQIKQKLLHPSARVKDIKQRKGIKQKHHDNMRPKNIIPFDNEEIMPKLENKSRYQGENEYDEIHTKYAPELKNLKMDKFGDPKEKNLIGKSSKKEVVTKRDNSTQKDDNEENYNLLRRNQEQKLEINRSERKFNEKGMISENKAYQKNKKKDSSNEVNLIPIENGYNRNTNESANNNDDLTRKTYIDPKFDKLNLNNNKNAFPFIKKNDSLREMKGEVSKKNSLKLVALNYDDKEENNIFLSNSPLNNAFTTDNRNAIKNMPLDNPMFKNNNNNNFNPVSAFRSTNDSKPQKFQKFDEQLKFIEKIPLNRQNNIDPINGEHNMNNKDDDIPKFPSISESFKPNNKINRTDSKINFSKSKLNDEFKNELTERKSEFQKPLESIRKKDYLLVNSGHPKNRNNEMINDVLKNSLIDSPNDKNQKLNLNLNLNQNNDNEKNKIQESKLIDGKSKIGNQCNDNSYEKNNSKIQDKGNQNRINFKSTNRPELNIKGKDIKNVNSACTQVGKSNIEALASSEIKDKSKEQQVSSNSLNFPSVMNPSANKDDMKENPSITLNKEGVKSGINQGEENLNENLNEVNNELNANEEEENLEESSVESHPEEAKEPEKLKSEIILEKLKSLNYPNLCLEDHYTKMDKIGEGTYGVVYMAKDNRTNEIIALKKIKIENDQIAKVAIREIEVLIKAAHPNVVKLREVVFSGGELSLIFEYCDYDLQIFLNKFQKLGLKLVKSFFFQMLKGLEFCHSKNILHRDIKAKNLLIDKNMKIKICDFGLAREFDSNTREFTHEVITRWYRPPEILLGQKEYNTSVDIWSSACLFALMAQNKHLFPGEDEIDQLNKIFKVMGTPDEKSWPGVSSLPDFKNFPACPKVEIEKIVQNLDTLGYDLLKRMLVLNPAKRISASEALSHPFFDEIRNLYSK